MVAVSSRYRVLKRLGAGGMGEVYLAQDTELERQVAIKVMSRELASDPNQRKRFRTEARAASGLVHPNVCVIHEVGETEDGRPFLAMEFVEGQLLSDLLQQRRLRIREAIKVGMQVAEALEAAHSRGIVHRDIKPANLMVDQRGHLKVLDFGLAKRFGHEELSGTTTSLAQTRSGMLIGTPYYMSPEQVLGRELDPRSDVFSLGVVLYELVVGQKPFLGKTVGETLNNVVNQVPEPLGLENPFFSPSLDGIILKCLEKDPAKRYPSARELAVDLRALYEKTMPAPQASNGAIATQPGVTPAPPAPETRPPEPKRTLPIGTILAGTAALLVVVIGTVWHLRSRPADLEPPPPPAAPGQKVQQSVAVLPFDNLTGEASSDYLSEGLTEEITSALSRIPGLKVAARNSAAAFSHKQDVRQIGATLRVNSVLEGSVRKAGNQIRVTAQLINTADGFQLWSESYDRSVDDLFSVQEEIARRIAERLQGNTNGAVLSAQPVEPETHKLYVEARVFWNKRTEAGLAKAIELFRAAIDRKPDYAAAHAGLASSYVLFPLFAVNARPSSYHPLARAAAEKAIKLDPRCAEAYAVLGILAANRNEPQTAERYYLRAIELDPNFPTAHHWYGRFLNMNGRHEEGLAQLRTAIDLDPLSPILHATIPEYYWLNRDFDRAVQEGRNVVQQFPEFPAARHLLIAALIKRGSYPEALSEIEKARTLQGETPLMLLDMQGYVLARSGRESDARQIMARLEQERKQGKSVEGMIAFMHLAFREYDQALDIWEKIVAAEGVNPEAACDPFCDELRSLPRFQAMLQKAGLNSDSLGLGNTITNAAFYR